MANYYTQFSEVIPHLTEEEKAWLERALQDPYDLDDEGFEAWESEFGDLFENPESREFGFTFCENDSRWADYLWVYSEDSGCIDPLLNLAQVFLAKFRPTEWWTITWANTCSKPRVSEFGGGWAIVTADRIECGDAWDMVSKAIKALTSHEEEEEEEEEEER